MVTQSHLSLCRQLLLELADFITVVNIMNMKLTILENPVKTVAVSERDISGNTPVHQHSVLMTVMISSDYSQLLSPSLLFLPHHNLETCYTRYIHHGMI